MLDWRVAPDSVYFIIINNLNTISFIHLTYLVVGHAVVGPVVDHGLVGAQRQVGRNVGGHVVADLVPEQLHVVVECRCGDAGRGRVHRGRVVHRSAHRGRVL